MNNILNFDPAQPTPATQGISGKTPSSDDKNAFFAAILNAQITVPSANVDGAEGAGSSSDLTQGLASSIALLKMLPAWMAQTNDPKVPLPTNDQVKQALDGSTENNPALAMWIAAMAAAQMQLNIQDPKQIGNAGQFSGSGLNGVTNALQAMEQQFPQLADLAKKLSSNDKHESDITSDKSSVNATPTPAPTVNPAQPKAEEKLNQTAVLLKEQTNQPEKVDPVQASAKISSPKFPVSPEKTKHENPGIDFNKKTDSRETTQPVPQVQNANVKAENQSADTKNQDPSQAQQGHSNSDTKKDSSAAQFQAPADTVKNSSEPNGAAMQQNNFSAIAQTTPRTGSNSPVHAESSTSSQPLNVREAGNVSGTEATPRIVHAARLMEAAGQAEMRVSVKSEVAGSIDVRAMLQGEHISATVAAQHGGTRDWLTANMHELQASLSKDDLNLKTFEVTDSSLQNNGRGTQSHSQEQQQQNKGTYLPFENETHSAITNLEDMEVQENSSRALSLLA